MKLAAVFKSVIDSDGAPVVICDTAHTIVYMNPSAAVRYAKRGGLGLVGKSLLACHSTASNEKIRAAVDWFAQGRENNRLFTYHDPGENKDVYMIALRDEAGGLIGYYEKHEYRTPEAGTK